MGLDTAPTIEVMTTPGDRDDAAASGIAMARFMMRLLDFLTDKGQCEQRIHLVAHSMGNWALRHAVQGLISLQAQARLPTRPPRLR